MKQFKYKTIKKDDNFKKNSSEEDVFLNKQGEDGWELVGVVLTNPSYTFNKNLYYFKKEITK